MELILLHGAIGAGQQLTVLAQLLGHKYNVHIIDFEGHGGRKMPTEPFSIPLFAQNVLDYMDEHQIASASIIGYSMGGFVGLYLARHYADRIQKIITLATKFEWSEAIAARELKMLDTEKIEQKLPDFAKMLENLHAPNDWKAVLQRTGEMMVAMGQSTPLTNDDFSAITHPTLIMLGDRDKMVSLDETLSVYKSMPDARLCILPGTPHPIDQVEMACIAFLAGRFLG